MQVCGIPLKIASRCLVVFESILIKLLLIISICSIVYSPTWLPVCINFAFLLFAIFSLATYSFCWKRKNNVFVLPILIYESVTIFWITIWVYASVTAVTSGYLWSLEWLGGPQSGRVPVSHDIMSEHYVDPNETNPETKKAIKYGSIVLVASIVVLIVKVLAWNVARRVFQELRNERINELKVVNREMDYVPSLRSGNTDDKRFVFPSGSPEQIPMLQTNSQKLSTMQKESYI